MNTNITAKYKIVSGHFYDFTDMDWEIDNYKIETFKEGFNHDWGAERGHPGYTEQEFRTITIKSISIRYVDTSDEFIKEAEEIKSGDTVVLDLVGSLDGFGFRSLNHKTTVKKVERAKGVLSLGIEVTLNLG